MCVCNDISNDINVMIILILMKVILILILMKWQCNIIIINV